MKGQIWAIGVVVFAIICIVIIAVLYINSKSTTPPSGSTYIPQGVGSTATPALQLLLFDKYGNRIYLTVPPFAMVNNVQGVDSLAYKLTLNNNGDVPLRITIISIDAPEAIKQELSRFQGQTLDTSKTIEWVTNKINASSIGVGNYTIKLNVSASNAEWKYSNLKEVGATLSISISPSYDVTLATVGNTTTINNAVSSGTSIVGSGFTRTDCTCYAGLTPPCVETLGFTTEFSTLWGSACVDKTVQITSTESVTISPWNCKCGVGGSAYASKPNSCTSGLVTFILRQTSSCG